MSAPYKRIELDKTLTGSEVKSLQFDIRPFNQHELKIGYDPDAGSGAGVQLEARIYGSNDSLGTTRDNSKWKQYGRHEDYELDGVLTFTPKVVRARAEVAADLNQVYQFPLGTKKIYVSYLENGSPGAFGKVSIDLSSHSV